MSHPYSDPEKEGMIFDQMNEMRKNRRLKDRVDKLTAELATATARIAELEKCCVIGGDGKPIVLANEIVVECVKRIMKDDALSSQDRWCLLEDLRFRITDGMRQLRQGLSSPEDVPGGAE